MNSSAMKKGIAPRYALRFECIGPNCPDNCCHGWNVGMDRESYTRVQQVLPRAEMTAHIKKVAPGSGAGYAAIVMKEDGVCPFLDPADSLCTIHKQHGDACLSLTCRQYPRQISLIGDTLELALNISCPEAARLCLLDESATELVEFDPDLLLKKGVGFYHTQPTTPAQRYPSYLNDFRAIMLQLLANHNLPFTSRLFISLYFARQVSPHVYDGVEVVDDSRIIQELEQLLAPGYMDDLHTQFETLPHSADFSMSLLQGIILARLNQKGMLAQLIHAILADNNISPALMDDEIEAGSAFSTLLNSYQQRRELLYGRFGTAIDQYFENYSRNFWFKDLFIKAPSLLSQMQNLIVRIAVVKFLFFSHPGLKRLIDSVETLTQEEMRKILDEVAVNAFYQFSRGIEHDKGFLATLHRELGRQQLDSFAHLVLLMKF